MLQLISLCIVGEQELGQKWALGRKSPPYNIVPYKLPAASMMSPPIGSAPLFPKKLKYSRCTEMET